MKLLPSIYEISQWNRRQYLWNRPMKLLPSIYEIAQWKRRQYLWNRCPVFMKLPNEIVASIYEIVTHHLWNRCPAFMKSLPSIYEIATSIYEIVAQHLWNRPPAFMKSSPGIYEISQWNRPGMIMKSLPSIYEIVPWHLWNRCPAFHNEILPQNNEIVHLIICQPLYTTYGRDLPQTFQISGYHQPLENNKTYC